jgi:hypothetical protein
MLEYPKKNIAFFKTALKKILPSRILNLLSGIIYDFNLLVYLLALNSEGKYAKKLIADNIDVVKDFRAPLNQMLFDFDGAYKADTYIDSYKKKKVKLVKSAKISASESGPILLCVIKNDFVKVKAQLEYHRRIGIKRFAYIDNMSTDGVFEWLESQDDVSLFRTDEKFNDLVKESWKRQATDNLGYEKWYLIVDPDEFFIYPGIEHIPLNEYIRFLEKQKITAAPALMTDMYTKEALFNSVSGDFMKDYRFFDTNTYRIRILYRSQFMDNGPRRRLFADHNTLVQPALTKYALVKLSKSMILTTHKNYPNKLNFQTNGAAAFLLHYKFLPSEKSKYEEFAKPGGINSLASEDYKQMAKVFNENPNISFYFEGSQKLNDSMDLMKINVTDKKFFKKFFTQAAKEKLV